MSSIGKALKKIAQALKSKGLPKLPAGASPIQLQVTLATLVILRDFPKYKSADDVAHAVDGAAARGAAANSKYVYDQWASEIVQSVLKNADGTIRSSNIFKKFEQSVKG